eukprot:scaffold2852_cov54-Cyclotella_meneghiniana.AAC.2
MQLSPFGRRTSTSRDDSDRHNSDTTQAEYLQTYDKRVNGTLIAAMMAGVKARGYYECNSDDLWLELLSTHMVRALM